MKIPPLKSILITGCSSGIGLDTALAFRDAGWRVIASCRNEKDCLVMQTRHKVHSVRIDYADEGSIYKGFADALEYTGGQLNVLFNNGAYGIPALVEDLPTPALRAIFETNFFGWHTLSRLAIAQMRNQNEGRIIQNSSVLGFAPLKFRGAYNATKFALEGLTDTMRLELDHTNIHLILIEPGPIRTKIRENAYKQFKHWITWSGTANEAWYKKVAIPSLSAIDPPRQPFELMPSAVTKAVMHAATSSRPKLRYRVTTATTLMMICRRLLSTRIYDALARRL